MRVPLARLGDTTRACQSRSTATRLALWMRPCASAPIKPPPLTVDTTIFEIRWTFMLVFDSMRALELAKCCLIKMASSSLFWFQWVA